MREMERFGTFLVSLRRGIAPLLFGLFMAGLIPFSAHASQASAKDVVEAYHAKLLQAMKEAETLGYDGRYKLLAPAIGDAFDLRYLARRSAGTHWRKFTPGQKTKYVDAFSRMSISTYARRFNGYKGESFRVLKVQETSRGDSFVHTEIVKASKDTVALNYLLRKKGERWRVIDVYLKGTISEVATRRSDFGSVLRTGGYDALIAAIEKKIAAK